LVYDGFSGTYLVDLREDPKPTTLLPGGSGFSVEAFCQDSRYWVEWGDDSAYYVATVADGEVSKRRLGDGFLKLSSDADLIALELVDDEGDALGVRLFPCSAAEWVEPFDEAVGASFGPGAQLLLTLAAGGLEIVSLQDPEQPVPIWSSPVAERTYAVDFNRAGSKLLVELPEANDDLSLHVVDLTSPSEPVVSSLHLPPYAEVAALGESSILAWSNGTYGEPRDLLWQTLDASDDPQHLIPEPLVVYSDASDDITRLHRVPFDEKSVFLTRLIDEQTTLSMLRFDGMLLKDQQITQFPGTVRSLVAAADGHGMAVLTSEASIDNKVWWISFSQSGEPSEPALLADESLYVSMQPWP
jgi:hypothetical protein